MRLIELTTLGGPMWVNPAHIVRIRPAPHDQTAIWFVNQTDSEWVKESPAEVVFRIRELSAAVPV